MITLSDVHSCLMGCGASSSQVLPRDPDMRFRARNARQSASETPVSDACTSWPLDGSS